MLKTLGNIKSKTQAKKGGVGVNGNDRAKYSYSGFDGNEVDGVEVAYNKVGKKD